MSEEKISLSNQAVTNVPGPGEAGFVPPAAAVPLPSRGAIYPIGHPLHGKEILEIRAMTARDEDILTSRALVKSGRVIDVLLKACMVDKSIDVDSMLFGDRNAALVAIRITGYGQEYAVEVECPACGNKFKHEFNLSVLPVKRLGADPRELGKNEFVFTLPVSRKEVLFKLLNGADERELSTTLEATRKASGGAESLVTTRLQHQILAIGNESDKGKLAMIIRNLPARDSRDLRKYMNSIAPDVVMTQEAKCPSCTEVSSLEVPMGTEFFWPAT